MNATILSLFKHYRPLLSSLMLLCTTLRIDAFGAQPGKASKTPFPGFIAQLHQDSTSFTDINGAFPFGVRAYWADYDNDGDLDLLLVGAPDGVGQHYSTIFRSDSGVFHDIGAVLTSGVMAAWGDYDNDGDLDLVIAGPTGLNNSNPVVKIYRNDNGAFVDINAAIPGLVGTVAWCDYNNDGNLDLIVTGSPDNGSTVYTRIYRNDGGNFTDIGANLPGVWGSSAAWGDYDNDGDQDLALTGYGEYGVNSFIFRNDGPSGNSGWIFTNINAPITPMRGGTVSWGDYDNDGNLDLLATGTTYGGGAVAKVYRNDGIGNFIDTGDSLKQLGYSGAAWGDYDNDGHLDILLSGSEDISGTNPTTKIYRNANGKFIDINASIVGAWYGSVGWGDYDNDGDLDFLLAGAMTDTPPYDRITKIYRNNLGSNIFTVNTVPTSPTNLSSIVAGDTVRLSWNKSTDNQTVQDALSYNFRVGTTPGGVETVTPLANPSTGHRKVVQLGNTDLRNSWTLKNLPVGTYYWSVQAIDNAFAGSTFAPEQSFTISAVTPQLAPQILSVRDVSHDQGGKVSVIWEASSRDVNVNNFPFYSIWRALPGGTVVPAKITPPARITENFRGSAYRLARLNGLMYAWEWIANQPANRFTMYAYTASTLYDSTSATDGKHYFLITGHTSDPNIFFDSKPDSGHSVDNLAPSQPRQLTGGITPTAVVLYWIANHEPDLKGYSIYRSTSPNINPLNLAPVASTTDTSFMDRSPIQSLQLYYVVCASDIHGNLSPRSNEVDVTLVSVIEKSEMKPDEYALHQNYPNPFNPTTIIPFDVAKDGFVSIRVYNTLGQEIATVVNGELSRNSYQVFFDASALLSGVYYYRMTVADGETGRIVRDQTKKLLLLR